ncbi:O-GLYCOSYL HYDROLASES FAMILY 17 PROTEIN [Salix viminalis]|uniref:glucan endo-1,3-beta-D-glucosidase n=1 Tax=Salix viminalis TaxID=40686 RepID=A0A9Q0SDA8_SALVM|nr:O-GLYCOSYL HYDROLASES FAMILY 17 PROTEIN [Salix viminalis]
MVVPHLTQTSTLFTFWPDQTNNGETPDDFIVFFTGLHVFLLLASAFNVLGVEGSIGVNYGTVADDLPPPAQVARFLFRIHHYQPAITITVPNDQIPLLTKLGSAQEWLKSNVQPYVPATNIVRVLVGNEVISTGNKLLVASLVPAMKALHAALVGASLDHRIKISTPHSLGILSDSSPPSTGKFRRGYATRFLKPLLSFLRATNSPFMINPYPFFGFSPDTLDYALFRPNSGVFDENTKLSYTNMLDGQLDAVFSAMKLLGFSDIEIVIAETGWPSQGEPSQLGVDAGSAAQYNRNLMQHVTSDLKPGPISERNFGLFRPDMTPVYNIGILRAKAKSSIPTNPAPAPVVAPVSPGPRGRPEEKIWCLPKPGADVEALQRNIDYVCGLEVELCKPIQEGGACFLPNTVRAHASFAMNAYYQGTEKNDYDCDFKQTAAVSNVDPSYGNCKY